MKTLLPVFSVATILAGSIAYANFTGDIFICRKNAPCSAQYETLRQAEKACEYFGFVVQILQKQQDNSVSLIGYDCKAPTFGM